MAVENSYNVVKVNELREITVAQGGDQIIINDIDSSPLETKKITAENFAESIKDYILPIATDTVLGGVKIGDGLTINPITGVLSNDILILDDLDDVIILNPEAGHVLRYNGVQWINEEEGGIVNVIAGDGLSGGGSEGEITIDVNAGAGLGIELDSVVVLVRNGLEIVNDHIDVRLNPGLTFSSNSITIVPGTGLNIANGAVNFVPGLGLIQAGAGIRVDIGDGMSYVGNQIAVVPGHNLILDNNQNLSVPEATYDTLGVSKFAPLVNRIEEIRGTDSYEDDQINPAFVDKLSFVPTGAVFYFASGAVPDGFLFCDGSQVSTETYKYLFEVIGTTFNDGTEQINRFRLPDLRDEFIRGANTLDQNGRYVGLKEDHQAEVAPHKHAITQTPYTLVGGGGTGTGSVTIPWGAGYTGNYWDPPATKGLYPARPVIGNMTFNLDGFDPGDDYQLVGALADETELASVNQETRPRNIALLPCIKT